MPSPKHTPLYHAATGAPFSFTALAGCASHARGGGDHRARRPRWPRQRRWLGGPTLRHPGPGTIRRARTHARRRRRPYHRRTRRRHVSPRRPARVLRRGLRPARRPDHLHRRPGRRRASSSGSVALQPKWTPFRDGILQTPLPAGVVFDQLFVDGTRQVRARFPDFDAAPSAARRSRLHSDHRRHEQAPGQMGQL